MLLEELPRLTAWLGSVSARLQLTQHLPMALAVHNSFFLVQSSRPCQGRKLQGHCFTSHSFSQK